MKFKAVLSYVFFISLAFSSCKKEDRQKNYPSETTTGANTFGCYLDNNQFLPCKITGGISPVRKLQATSFFYYPGSLDITISAVNDCENETFKSIFIRFDSVAITANTAYKLSNYSGGFRNKVVCSYYQDGTQFQSDSTLNGYVMVTYFDKEQRILSGRFEVTLQVINSSNKVQVTKGIFDVKF